MTAQGLTIRQMIDEKITKLRNVDSLSPQEIAQEAIELSSLWASVNKEIVDRRLSYNEVLKNLTIEHGTVSKAKVYAETTPEFREWLIAEAYSKSVAEMVRTTKRAVSLAEQELREVRT
mgnify:CR=1 FL=1